MREQREQHQNPGAPCQRRISVRRDFPGRWGLDGVREIAGFEFPRIFNFILWCSSPAWPWRYTRNDCSFRRGEGIKGLARDPYRRAAQGSRGVLRGQLTGAVPGARTSSSWPVVRGHLGANPCACGVIFTFRAKRRVIYAATTNTPWMGLCHLVNHDGVSCARGVQFCTGSCRMQWQYRTVHGKHLHWPNLLCWLRLCVESVFLLPTTLLRNHM